MKKRRAQEVLKVLKISGDLNYGLIWDLNSSPWPWGLGLQPSDKKFMNIQNIRSSISDILLLCFCEMTPGCSNQSMSQCAIGPMRCSPVGAPTNWFPVDAILQGCQLVSQLKFNWDSHQIRVHKDLNWKKLFCYSAPFSQAIGKKSKFWGCALSPIKSCEPLIKTIKPKMVWLIFKV